MPLYSARVDVGSTQTKAVVLDEPGRIAGRALIDTGANVVQAAEQAHQAACRDADVPEEDVLYALSTTSCPPGVPRCMTRDDGTGPTALVAVNV